MKNNNDLKLTSLNYVEKRKLTLKANEKPAPSKSRLKKCEKGLHEFSETGFSENNIKKWACIHCGTFMHNR